MSSEPDYIQGYAVIRVYTDRPLDQPRELSVAGGPPILSAGPSNIKVREIVMSVDEARCEVHRLNALKGDKNCAYYWQATHIFLKGGSHGSKGRAESI